MAFHGRLTRAAAAFATPAALATLAALPPTPAQAQMPGAELRILSPRAGDSVGASSFALDVSFQSKTKSPVVTAELWVDGVRWVRRDLDTPQMKNVLSFDVDSSTLSEGQHAFVIKVFNADGATAQTEIRISAGTNLGTLEGSAYGPDLKFLTPGNGKRVAGTVELQLDAKARNGVNPYVTFYVDKKFKTLKNYPPYTYDWDTTTASNGYHTIEATGYLDANNATTTRRIKVFVDNPGGNTTVQNDIPDLRKAAKPTTSAVTTVAPQPKKEAVKTVPSSTPARLSGVALKSSVEAKALGLEAISIAPSIATPLVAPSTIAAPSVKPTAPRVAQPAKPTVKTVKMVTETAAAPSASTMAMHPAPLATVKPAAVNSLEMPVFAAPVIPVAPTVPVRVSVVTPVASAHIAPMVPHVQKATKATPHAAVKPTGSALLDMMTDTAVKPLQVAFDGQRIAFDVQPRIEAGLPIAPFRQIFEHTGGQVMWVPQSQVVRAVNADREVVIKVGKKDAQVNGQTFSMERAAFIERGRTIVPLSFVGKALDVDVKYDATTGRLQITSKQ